MTRFQQLVRTLEEDSILHGHKRLAVAGVSKENAEREMNEFLEQMEPDDATSIPPTPKTVASDEFEVIISSDEEDENEDKNDSDDWIVNDTE